MDSPIRQYQKQKDYLRHKLFRKIKRRKRAQAQQEAEAPLREMRRRVLKRFKDGKDIKRFDDGEDVIYESPDIPINISYVPKSNVRVNPETGGVLTRDNQEGALMLPEVEIVANKPTAAQRLGAYMKKAPAADIDKVMFGTLALGALPVAAQALPSLAPGSAFWTNPITQETFKSTIGALGVDAITKVTTGTTPEEFAESHGVPSLFSPMFNPGTYTGSLIGKSINFLYNTANNIPKIVNNTRRILSPTYDFYKTISETTPRITPTLHGFYTSDLTGSGFVENVYTGSPIFEFVQTIKTSPEKAYFMRAPKNVDVLKLGNGRFRHEVVGNEVLPSGEVKGKFVSYGEPWQEFALGENSALYEFPVGPGRGPSLMATDWKGRVQGYSVDEVYDYMQQEKALKKELALINKTMGDDFLKQYSIIRRNLINEKYHTLKEHIDTSIYGANQTVIPNERWNFDKFLKTPFWKYSENPISGQVQKELFMPQQENALEKTSIINWEDAVKDIKRFDDGKLIPLSQRFNWETNDSRWNSGKDPGIHINPKNRGKFNALKKRTGKTTEQLTHSKNPLTRKRAIFVLNAKRWRHK